MSHVIGFVVAGILLALASLLPETLLCLLSCLAMSVITAWALENSKRPYLGLMLFGTVFGAIAFYWLPDTITLFGGFPIETAYGIFLLFCLSAALQFVLFGYLYFVLRQTPIDALHLAIPFAWMVSELVFPRMFPWQVGHSCIVWKPIAALAEWGGVVPISGLVFWWGTTIFRLARDIDQRRSLFTAGTCLCVAVSLVLCCAGYLRNRNIIKESSKADEVIVAMIQGNLSTSEKGDVRMLEVNLDRYRTLSTQAQEQGAEFIIWPESVMNSWLPADMESVRGTRLDPFPNASVPLLYGTLTYRPTPKQELNRLLSNYEEDSRAAALRSLSTQRFNAGVGVSASGKVLGTYHKRILMPFGEFIPFADIYPELKKLSPQTGDFSVGDILEPMRIPIEGENGLREKSVLAGILICYEDLIPSLSGDFAAKGANILINLTNDAWYGDTAAPFQHHLLAQWRAIETRRYLLRATNTGYTAIVDPFGTTVGALDIFEEGLLLQPVRLLTLKTFYSKVGDSPLWALAIFVFSWCIFGRFFRAKSEKSPDAVV